MSVAVTNRSAVLKQKELIAEKIKDGFKISKFEECLENTVDVYDKAKWHFSGNFPADLDPFQGYIHTGLFLGWLIERNLVSEEFIIDNEETIALFKEMKLTSPELFERSCDGVLMLEDLNEDGNRFALYYFDFSNGLFVFDYENTLSRGLPSMYHVRDTWDNYNKIKPVFDKRFYDYNEMWKSLKL